MVTQHDMRRVDQSQMEVVRRLFLAMRMDGIGFWYLFESQNYFAMGIDA